MRTAWNVRVATWVRLDHAARGTARFTTETRSAAVSQRAAAPLRSTSTRAMRRACRSSPCSASRTSISSAARRPSKLRGGVALARVEAHVERLLTLERESAAGFVELIRREAEVQQHRGRALHARVRRDRAQVAEAAAHQHHAGAEALQAARRARERFGVAIDTEQAALATRRLQQPLRVSTHADCPVHHQPPRRGRKRNVTSSSSTGM